MIVNQIYSLINAVSNECWGLSAPSVKDLSGLISLGESINGGQFTAGADKFLDKLVDKVSKTVIRTVDRRLDMPKLLMEGIVFGSMIEKVDVQPISATRDNSWNIGAGDYSTDYFTVYKPNIDVTLFKDIDTWKVSVSVPDVLFRSAFTSESAMNSFITAIMDSLTGSLESQLNKMSHICVCNFIGEKKKNSNGIVNLVTMYNTAKGYTSESAGYQPIGKSALYNKDFLNYASYVINNYIAYMEDEGTFYNVGSKIRATSRDNMHVMMLKAFTSACDSFLSSSTFHNELVSLPLYSSVNYWQYNAGEDFDYKSSIVVIPSSEKGAESPVTQTIGNVIGVLADRQAIAVSMYERWSASDRINSERRTNFTQGANIGYINDISENGIILTFN